MTETEYIRFRNKVILNGVRKLLSEIVTGDEYGITRDEYVAVYKQIDSIEWEIQCSIKIDS